MKKIILSLLALFSMSAFAQNGAFEGNWYSREVSLIVNEGDFSSCNSEISIQITKDLLDIKSPVVVSCDEFTFFTETVPLQILEGGVLVNSRSRSRGTLSDDLIEIYTPILFPDGSFIYSYASLTLLSDETMLVKLELKHAGYILDLSGIYSK